MKRVYDYIFSSAQIINYLNNDDQKTYYNDKYEEALTKVRNTVFLKNLDRTFIN